MMTNEYGKFKFFSTQYQLYIANRMIHVPTQLSHISFKV